MLGLVATMSFFISIVNVTSHTYYFTNFSRPSNINHTLRTVEKGSVDNSMYLNVRDYCLIYLLEIRDLISFYKKIW